MKNKHVILEFIAEKSTEESSKQSQIIYRNKNGQFTSPPDGSKLMNTVNIFRYTLFPSNIFFDLVIAKEKN
jgi:hypothetical protein